MTAELERKEVLAVLDRDGLDAAIEIIGVRARGGRLARHAAAAFAERVLPIFESARPGDLRPRRAIEVARDDNATPEELAKAADDALDASLEAARAGAWDAERDACAAVWAARGAVWDAAQAARAAVLRLAIRAAEAAKGAAEKPAVWADAFAARDAEGAAQSHIIRKMLTEGF